LRSAASPPIHIRAGENVCIQAITPAQPASDPASTSTRRIESGSVSTARARTGTGIIGLRSSAAASFSAWTRT
jgi:hypothetical protein